MHHLNECYVFNQSDLIFSVTEGPGDDDEAKGLVLAVQWATPKIS